MCRQDVAFLVPRTTLANASNNLQLPRPQRHSPTLYTICQWSHTDDDIVATSESPLYVFPTEVPRCSVIKPINDRAVRAIIRAAALLGLPRPLHDTMRIRAAWTENRHFQFRLSFRPQGSTRKIERLAMRQLVIGGAIRSRDMCPPISSCQAQVEM
jgi:hypothetical protein